jgi:plastocyanin
MDRPRRTPLGIPLMILILLLAACGGASESTPADDDGGATPTADDGGAEPTEDDGDDGDGGGEGGNTVSLSGGAFSPTSLTVAVGDTVTFTATGGHTVTEGSNGTAVDDPIVDETGGADIEVTFDEPGRYNITCRIHPAMNMTITVEG